MVSKSYITGASSILMLVLFSLLAAFIIYGTWIDEVPWSEYDNPTCYWLMVGVCAFIFILLIVYTSIFFNGLRKTSGDNSMEMKEPLDGSGVKDKSSVNANSLYGPVPGFG